MAGHVGVTAQPGSSPNWRTLESESRPRPAEWDDLAGANGERAVLQSREHVVGLQIGVVRQDLFCGHARREGQPTGDSPRRSPKPVGPITTSSLTARLTPT